MRSSELYNRLLRLMATRTAGAPTQPVHCLRSRTGRIPCRGSGKLLVAEDNEVNQLVARGMANRLGYEVHIVDDGDEAVSAALSGSVRGRAHGLPHARDGRLRRHPGHPRPRTATQRRIPIIAMTAGALDEDRERCFAAGMDDYISKPVDLAKLAEVLSRWVPEQEQTSTAEGGGVCRAGRCGGRADACRTPAASAEAPASNSVVLDLERLQILRELGPADGLGLLPEAVRAFRQDSQKPWRHCGPRWMPDKPQQWKRPRTSSPGAAANIGAAGAAGLCKDLERLGREAGPDLASHGIAGAGPVAG